MAQTRTFDLNTVKEFARQCSNWGKWGAEDELGTINYITPEKVRQAAQLVKKGKVISLAIPFDGKGPQTGGFGRFNPIHMMTMSGADAAAGAQDFLPVTRGANDIIIMPLQCATQWDSLAHIFFEGLVIDNQKDGLFRVNRRAFTDLHILELEKDRAFAQCWIYAGHESEVEARTLFRVG